MPAASKQLSTLKQIADSVRDRGSPAEGIESLARAFELFSQETARLESSYAALKQKFQDVNLLLKDKVLELDATTHYLNSILANMTQGLIFVGLDGIISTFNRSAEQILHVPAGNVLFRRFGEVFTDTRFGFSMETALSAREVPDSTIVSYSIKDLPSSDLEISAKLVMEQHESIQGIILLVRDVTEIKRLQNIANRHDRMQELGEMAAFVAHEIRNPLGGIGGFASLLVRDLADKPALQNMARQIVDGTKVLNRLVSNVLHYARPLKPRFQTLDLGALVNEVTHLIRHDTRYSSTLHQVRVLKLEGTVPVSGDPDLLKSALLNLIINAIEAMPGGGEVTLELAPLGDVVRLDVVDEGHGIEKECLEKIFSPFFTTKHDGNGFGLTEVHKAIEVHSGNIEVESSVGHGTTFKVRLPIQK